MEHWQGN